MTSMISTRSRDCSARLGRGVCDQAIMSGAVISVPLLVPRAVIDVRVVMPWAVIGVRVVMPWAVIGVRVIMPWVVIGVRVARSLRMIMPVRGRCWFGEWVADVVGN
jgi:hypothetical protein